MRYTIHGFSQKRLIELGLDDRDALILRYFVDFKDTDEMYSEQVGGETYYWVKYESIRKELPIIGDRLQKDAIYRRFRYMAKIGVLKHYHKKSGGSFSFYTLGKEYYPLISSSELPTQPELSLHPSGSKAVPSDPKTVGGAVLKPEGCGFKTGAKDQSIKDQSIKKIREKHPSSCALKYFLEKFPQVRPNNVRQRLINETVTNLAAWEYTCTHWEVKGYQVNQPENMVDFYSKKALPLFPQKQLTPPPADAQTDRQGSEWDHVKGYLAQRLNAPSFNTWIRPLTAEPMRRHGQVEIPVANDTFRFWLTEHYVKLFQDAYAAVRRERPAIVFTLATSPDSHAN